MKIYLQHQKSANENTCRCSIYKLAQVGNFLLTILNGKMLQRLTNLEKIWKKNFPVAVASKNIEIFFVISCLLIFI